MFDPIILRTESIIPLNKIWQKYRISNYTILFILKLHDNQMLFNKKLKALRDKKVTLVDEVNKGLDRLEQISFILGDSDVIAGTPPRPRLKLEEIPEK